MSLLMVYITVAVSVLSVVGTWCAKSLRPDPSRLVAILAAAALWPVLIVGLLQLGAIQLIARSVRRHAPMAPAMVAQQVGARQPA